MNGLYNEVAPASLGGAKRKKEKGVQSSGGPAAQSSKSKHNKRSSKNKNQSKPPTGSQQQASQNTNAPGEWPPSLHQFVVECFTRSNQRLTEDQKPLFNRQLQLLIEKAVSLNYVFENNWLIQKLPILDGTKELELECERRKALEAAGLTTSRPTNALANEKKQDTPTLNYTNLKRSGDFDSASRKKQRSQRFESAIPITTDTTPYSSNSTSPVFIGTCQNLEKNYLRLTSEPIPALVRPQEVLIKSVSFILKKYRESNSYTYVINQFKSIRQDLTVQHIKNDFTIYVYELNAKVSLENNDLGEFNQCQSQLKYLYYLKRKNEPSLQLKFFRCELEFLVYRTIYMIITNNHSEIYKIKLKVEQSYKSFLKDPSEKDWFQFLLNLFKLNQDLLLENYYSFFKLFEQFSKLLEHKLGYQLIKNFIVTKTRVKALWSTSKAYRKISNLVIIERLAFENDLEFKEFLDKYKLGDFKGEIDFDCLGARGVLTGIINTAGFKKVDIKGQI
ncbi:uncharacterized protein CANTADRAFT_188252 [Suhomyces tanzawaensis NRRL Y-17324]|uniref:SAC3/GANP/THP3 conserved domain-containing protein n=1 Tax=Suhomyces tanzawaensis NRRL Y-17324 TaxID=984487 RepID=A0A1E4SNC3_9ASCO|nr:uncharacterized protein CANTADRAFT_188252 [Suhomyces tanzawaensis NRRL Y-17324]ODV81021.1 hypothetical protein CANTADRAFT_188252 [Suhomyces tanzawaensis NRRL Y-17324]